MTRFYLKSLFMGDKKKRDERNEYSRNERRSAANKSSIYTSIEDGSGG